MSASDKTARKNAVCGAKPGGVDAYYFKEGCVLKGAVKRQRAPVPEGLNLQQTKAEVAKFKRWLKNAEKYYMENPAKAPKLVLPRAACVKFLMGEMVTFKNVQQYPRIDNRYIAACEAFNQMIARRKKTMPPVHPGDMSTAVTVFGHCQFFFELVIKEYLERE